MKFEVSLERVVYLGDCLSLLLWFHIMWCVVIQKAGASANNLMDFMGFGAYERHGHG